MKRDDQSLAATEDSVVSEESAQRATLEEVSRHATVAEARRGATVGQGATVNAWTTVASRRRVFIAGVLIFLAAFGVRLLSWQDTQLEVSKIQSVVVNDYKYIAKHFAEGGVQAFWSRSSPLANPNTLGHPPGYSILLAFVYSLVGESDRAVQFLQIIFDALAALLIFLIVRELLPLGVAVVAGLLAAFAPQFAWNSVLLLPDSLAVFPILLAILFLARAHSVQPNLRTIIAAGACVGLSCWLRANALLLAPFLAVAVLVLFERGRRLRSFAALLAGALLVVAPLTIRNAVVFGYFIPLSLGAGQTFLQGIADYDREGRFGIPRTDMGIMKWEAERYGRPDYFGTYFYPDGVERDRMRLKYGLGVVRSHPFWFAGTMARRATSMLRLERARIINREPPVTHSLAATNQTAPVWTGTVQDLLRTSTVAQGAHALLAGDDQRIQLTGDGSTYGTQLSSALFEVEADTDYVLLLSTKILRGRMSLSVRDERGVVYASTVVETLEMTAPEAQPEILIQLPFVSPAGTRARLVINNEASNEPNPQIEIGAPALHALGPASFTWTRIPRSLVRVIQKLYLTAVMLPLALIGLALLARARKWRTLLLLMVVPAYYLCVQSAFHTEYRYVLAVHYFLFALAAVTLYEVGLRLSAWMRRAGIFRRAVG